MKFSIGDPIRIKKTGEEGKVVNIISELMFEIQIKHSQFPIHKDEIEHPYLHWFTQKDKPFQNNLNQQKEYLKTIHFVKDKGLFLSFIHAHKPLNASDWQTQNYEVVLVNNASFEFQFQVKIYKNNTLSTSHQAQLKPNSLQLLFEITWNDLLDNIHFEWQLSCDDFNLKIQKQEQIKLKNSRLNKFLQSTEQRLKPILELPLITDLATTTKTEAIPFDWNPKTRQIKTQASSIHQHKPLPTEIDLHIEILNPQAQHWSNDAILKFQLEQLETFIIQSIQHQHSKIVIIHGIGNGVLRNAVLKHLNSYPQVSQIDNNYHPNFGYGATTVYFNF